MSITKFLTMDFKEDEIEVVQVERETESCVWVDGRRRQKDGWQTYHASWDEARQYLLRNATRSAEKAQRELDSATRLIVSINAMKPPSESA